MNDRCTLCEENEATTTYGLPVCGPCYSTLVDLQGDLEEMEAVDPHLAEQGQRVEEGWRRYVEGETP